MLNSIKCAMGVTNTKFWPMVTLEREGGDKPYLLRLFPLKRKEKI